MRLLAAFFGISMLVEGVMKQLAPRGWMRWLVDGPLAYMPEPVLSAGREYQDLSPAALRILGAMQLAAGGLLIWLLGRSSRSC